MGKNDEFCIKKGDVCIKNKEICIKNEELCIKIEEFCIKHDEFCRPIEAGLSFELKETAGEFTKRVENVVDDSEESDYDEAEEDDEEDVDDDEEEALSDWEDEQPKKKKKSGKKSKKKKEKPPRDENELSEEEDVAMEEWDEDEEDDADYDTVKINVPAPTLEERTLGDVLGLYTQLRMFFNMPGLVIGFFTLEQLMAALASTQEDRLLSEINMCMLRYLKYNDIADAVANSGSFGAKLSEIQLLPWLVMHGLSWPEVLRNFALEKETAGGLMLRKAEEDADGNWSQELVDMYIPKLARSVANSLSESDGGAEYWKLPPAKKVEALRFLCEVLLDTDAFLDELHHRHLKLEGDKSRKMKKSEIDEHVFEYEFCSVCGRDGEMVLCDGCPCAFHLACTHHFGEQLTAVPDGDWYCGSCHCDVLEPETTAVKPFGRDDDGNRYWCVGGQAFSEETSTGHYRQLSNREIQAFASVRTGKTIERNLARKFRKDVIPRLHKNRLDTRLVNEFTTVKQDYEDDEVWGNYGLYSSCAYNNGIDGMSFKPQHKPDPRAAQIGLVFNRYAIKECSWPALVNDSLCTITNVRAKLEDMESLIPPDLYMPTWETDRYAWAMSLSSLTGPAEFAMAVLKLEANLRPACFGVFWRDKASASYSDFKESELLRKIVYTTINNALPKDYFTSIAKIEEIQEAVQEEQKFTTTRSGRRSKQTIVENPDVERAFAAATGERYLLRPNYLIRFQSLATQRPIAP